MERRQPPCMRAAVWEVGKLQIMTIIAYRAAEGRLFCRPVTEKRQKGADDNDMVGFLLPF